jgi:oxygen-dependent protoporphyrinogen oxidase
MRLRRAQAVPSPPAVAKQIAILGGGLAGVTAAWQLKRSGHPSFTLFEASPRLGGAIQTLRPHGFTIELGPDGWVSEKPWARELAVELGLGDELIGSNDDGRVTWMLVQGKLVALPAGMRMMVPGDLRALERSALFSREAKRAYAAEPGRARALRRLAPAHDESVAAFVARHFGQEALTKVGAPLLSGVFGGDVAELSVRAVMPQFVKMEREHGSLIKALRAARATHKRRPSQPIFTSLRSGVALLIERMTAEIPWKNLRLQTPVTHLERLPHGWIVTHGGIHQFFDAVILATPAHVTARLLAPVSSRAAQLLTLQATSAILVAFAFDANFALPKGFGFLVPAGEANQLLAATFVDQKFPGRVPAGKRLVRAFFGGAAANLLAHQTDTELAGLALRELESILGRLPDPTLAVVSRWPRSLPQYAVGHVQRIAELDTLVAQLPGIKLIGNAYRGVGIPDVIRDARAAAKALI